MRNLMIDEYEAAIGDDREKMKHLLALFLYRNSECYAYDNAALSDAELEAEDLLKEAMMTDEELNAEVALLKQNAFAPTKTMLRAAETAVAAEWAKMMSEASKHTVEPLQPWPVSPTNWRILRAGWEAMMAAGMTAE